MEYQNNQQQPSQRKRGRPAGKNRVPLSKEQKRARNAMYERERRQAAADSVRDLAHTLGCSSDSCQEEVMATAVAYIRSRSHPDPRERLDELARLNTQLKAHIAEAKFRLRTWPHNEPSSSRAPPAPAAGPPLADDDLGVYLGPCPNNTDLNDDFNNLELSWTWVDELFH